MPAIALAQERRRGRRAVRVSVLAGKAMAAALAMGLSALGAG